MASQAAIEGTRPRRAPRAARGAMGGSPIAALEEVAQGAPRLWGIPVPQSIRHLRALLHAQSRIESRIVILQWLVMALVGIGAMLPAQLGSGLSVVQSTLVLVLLALHPVAYLAAAAFAHRALERQPTARVSTFTAIDVGVAVGVLFLTATKPGYTQVLLFSVVLLTATRYTLGRAIGITSLIALLQFFSIIAADTGLQITNLSSAVVAMFAMTYGVNQLSQAERKEASSAAENARLYRAVLFRNRELATINELSQMAGEDSDPDRLFESGMELILQSIPIIWGRAFRYDRRYDSLELLFIRQTYVLGAATTDPGALQDVERAARGRLAVAGPTAAVSGEQMTRIAAPVLVQGSVAGVLQAYVPIGQPDASGQPPAESLSIACQELGALVERAQLRLAAEQNLILEEKSRIARELHDTVLQLLFSSNLSVDWCLQRTGDDSVLAKKLGDVRRLTAQASNELRSAIFTLSSRVADVGLVKALEQLTASFVEQQELPASFSTTGQPPVDLPVLIQNALHRVVRESLMNVYKHAHASHAMVRLIFDRERIAVVIQDDGVGLPAQVATEYMNDPAHFGLRTVARQIEELRGQFEIMRGDEGGTIVRAVVPATVDSGGSGLGRDADH